MEIDFASGKAKYRRVHGGKELLLQALGKSKTPYEIIDATAGLGRDAFVLACAKHHVTLIERSPAIATLLTDALQRASQLPELTEIMNRMSLVTGDAKDYLALHTADIVYLDPMFPERKKTALVKKEMRLLQTLVGDDPDAGQLLTSALQAARKRVIVKRPLHAPELNLAKPNICYRGKTSRFDVYLPKIG
jgi:16S rRNA (guanine1516-N2)-methyltransferase